MKPPTDDDLILYYYGEAGDPEQIAHALGESPALARRFEELRRVLDAIPKIETPELPADYPSRVWSRLESQLAETPPAGRLLRWPVDRRWALAAAAMLLVVLSFVAGRFSSAPIADPSPPAPGQKILLVTLASHLERSEILLLELVNARAQEGAATGLDITTERLLAQELSGANRLYRQAARKAGELRAASLLDDLERLLVEVAHAPDELEADRLEELQQRLEQADLLFKIRVVGSSLRQQTEPEQNDSQSI